MAATETNSIGLDHRLRGDERMRHGASAAKRSVAVIIPTFNEAVSIGAVVAGLPRDVVSRVIVVDGGSSDGTRERAKDAGAEVIAVDRG
jgi:cellulose synthase/poly-beta-1,6-N-acetylglucosamine synthase-like glycosyltransferase